MRAQALWLCLALGVVSVGAYVSHRGAVSSGEAVEGDLVEYVPDPEYARLLALGHTPSLADVFWVRGVLYFGQGIQSKQKEGRFRWLASYIDVVVELDPDFESIYQWGGAAVIFSQPEVTVEQVRLANEILEAGAARFPGDYRFLLSAAANCKFYIRSEDVAIKKEMNECAAKYFKMAAERPGAPYYTALLASQLDDSQEACEVLMAMYLKEHRDPATRANIQGRLRDSSCGLSLLEEAERNQASFGRLRESVAPYVGDDLLVHIAPSAINRQGWLLDQEAEGSGDERE